MHELTLIANVVDAITARVGERPVVRVRLRVGELVAVVPDVLKFCFEATVARTPLEGAVLAIESIPARGRCGACARDFAMSDGIALCACGSANVEILAGRELVIQDVELRGAASGDAEAE